MAVKLLQVGASKPKMGNWCFKLVLMDDPRCQLGSLKRCVLNQHRSSQVYNEKIRKLVNSHINASSVTRPQHLHDVLKERAVLQGHPCVGSQ